MTKLLAVFFIATLLFFTIKSLPFLANKLQTLLPASRSALSLIQSPASILKTTADRTNLVLLGKGGAGHESPDLTDTIIFLSYHHPTGKTLMVSLPRDIWVDSLRAKLNTSYYYGELKQKGSGGMILAKAAVEEIIGQPVHYAVIINFQGFIKSIDTLGGITIEVKQSFDDYKYPIPGQENAKIIADRYQSLHFDSGPQTMSGERALKFVRSRNAEGDEGTDFARSARQQQVIVALQKKLLSTNFLLNPQKITEFNRTLGNSIETDIVNGDFTGFIKIALRFNKNLLQSADLSELLINPPTAQFDGQWVLIGQDNSWQQIQDHIKFLLDET